MKNAFVATTVFLLIFSINTHAQLFKGGFLAGFNACQVDGDTYSGYDHFGFMAGAFIYTPISTSVDIQFEIKYMGKGASKLSSETDPIKYVNNLNYIELPVILRVNTRSKFGIEGGLGFAYLFSSSITDNFGTYPTNFKTFELNMQIGGTYNITDKLKVDLRYSYSLTPILDPAGAAFNPYFLPRGAYNNLFTLGLYYTIGNK